MRGVLSPLRLVLLDMVGFLNKGLSGERELEGLQADLVYDIIGMLQAENVTFIWSNEAEYMGVYNETSQTYNGILGEADLNVLPSFGHLPNEPVTLGPIMFSEKTQLVSRLLYKEMPVDVTEFFLSLSTPVVVLLISCLLFFITLFTACEPNGSGKEKDAEEPIKPLDGNEEAIEPNGQQVAWDSVEEQSEAQGTGHESTSHSERLIHFLWHFYYMFLLHPLLQPKSFVGRVLMSFYVIGLLFFSWVWTNNMTSDFISLDTSMNVNNLDDLIERKDVRPLLIEQDTSTHLVLNSKDKRHMALVSRAFIAKGASGTHVDEKAKMFYTNIGNDFISGKVTIVANGLAINAGIKSMCPYIQQMDRDAKVYFGSESFFPAPFSPWYSRKMPEATRKALDDRYRNVIEGGINMNIMERAVDTVARSSPVDASVEGCVLRNVKDYFDEQKQMIAEKKGSGYTLKAMKGAFYILFSGISVATMVHMHSLIIHRLGFSWTRLGLKLGRVASGVLRRLYLKWMSMLRKASQDIRRVITQNRVKRNPVNVEHNQTPGNFPDLPEIV